MEGAPLSGRAAAPADRRRHVITLTSRGRSALGSAMAQRREWLGTMMAERLSEAERANLLAAAEIMLRIADPLEDDHAAH